jgi:hypothetical protein
VAALRPNVPPPIALEKFDDFTNLHDTALPLAA